MSSECGGAQQGRTGLSLNQDPEPGTQGAGRSAECGLCSSVWSVDGQRGLDQHEAHHFRHRADAGGERREGSLECAHQA